MAVQWFQSPSPSLALCASVWFSLGICLMGSCATRHDRTKQEPRNPERTSPIPSANDERSTVKIRIATMNASLFRSAQGQLAAELREPGSPQVRRVAEVIRALRPQILLINEFDHDPSGQAYEDFSTHYLANPDYEGLPIRYGHHFAPLSNTGIPSGADLDRDGQSSGAGDAFGYGAFPGQYGFVLYSVFPIAQNAIRTFQNFLWKDMPGALLPDGPAGEPGAWYSPGEQSILRLSSKNHVSVPVQLPGQTLWVLASHPTPPAFDGPEKRNQRRNHDEVRFWTDFITQGAASLYHYDDSGVRGGHSGGPFVILGDLNLDPADGDGLHEAIGALLAHPSTQDLKPTSRGAVTSAEARGAINRNHKGPAATDTAEFPPERVGNLRVDYVIPSDDLQVIESGVFWPEPGAAGASLFEPIRAENGASIEQLDHRPVYVDIDWLSESRR